ncbi:MAG: hypothetical protein FJ216_11630 [Ignavibacteria bacterium]|nr:hypothetical protein [Ignavibacteria bacterium]
MKKIKTFSRLCSKYLPFNFLKVFLLKLGSVVIGKNVKIGKNVYIGWNCVIGDDSIIGNNVEFGINVHIGKNVSVGNNVVINNFHIGDNSIIFREVVTEGGRSNLIKAGHHCSIGTRAILDHTSNITIGNYVNMSGVFNTHSSVLNALKRKDVKDEKQNERIYGDIEIGDNTFIGYFVNVNPGIKIGKNCVILSGVNIDKNVGDNTIVFPGETRTIKSDNLTEIIEKQMKLKK